MITEKETQHVVTVRQKAWMRSKYEYCEIHESTHNQSAARGCVLEIV